MGVTPGPYESSVAGTVYMRQPWLGCAPVDVYYDLTGLPHMMDHDGGHVMKHNFLINKYGDLANNCANVGAQFWPPTKHAGHGDHNPCEPDDKCCKYAHDTRDVELGNLGPRECGNNGALQATEKHNQFTLMGFHTVVGRSLVVKHMDKVMGCCTIGSSNSDSFPAHAMDAFSAIPDEAGVADEPDQHHHHHSHH